MKIIQANTWTLAGALLAVLVTGLLSTRTYDWASWRPATCLPDRCFCEAVASEGFRQRSNTWSSLGFVLASLQIVQQGLRDRRAGGAGVRGNLMRCGLRYPLTYGAAVFLIGVGSAFYHASLSYHGQFVDLFGMYLLATFILAYNLARVREVSQRAVIGGYLLANAALALALWHIPALRRYLFGLGLAGALLVEWLAVRRRGGGDLRLLWAALGLIAVAFLLWVGDITGLLCSRSSWAQGHAAWHLLGALSALALYYYYRSELASPAEATS